MKISHYKIKTDKKGIHARFAVVSDLHARPFGKVLQALEHAAPDAILLPGDIVEIATAHMDARNQTGLAFLKEAARLAPCYYCYGNHELYNTHIKGTLARSPEPELAQRYLEEINTFGVHLVNDTYEPISTAKGIYVGGLVCGRDMDPAYASKEPDLGILKQWENVNGFKILLCHYPHYYEQYLKNTDLDLILSGHAHGGQWRILGRGVYAPHQGLFPNYTSGIHDGRHIISRGVVNNARPIPRLFNPCEIPLISIDSNESDL